MHRYRPKGVSYAKTATLASQIFELLSFVVFFFSTRLQEDTMRSWATVVLVLIVTLTFCLIFHSGKISPLAERMSSNGLASFAKTWKVTYCIVSDLHTCCILKLHKLYAWVDVFLIEWCGCHRAPSVSTDHIFELGSPSRNQRCPICFTLSVCPVVFSQNLDRAWMAYIFCFLGWNLLIYHIHIAPRVLKRHVTNPCPYHPR